MENEDKSVNSEAETAFDKEWNALQVESEKPEPVDGSAAVVDDDATPAPAPAIAEELPAAALARIAEAERRAAEAEHRAQSDAGRQAALQRRVAELTQQLDSRPASQASDDLAPLKESYPEVAETVQSALRNVEQRVDAAVNTRMQALDAELAPIRQNEYRRAAAEQMSAVDREIPGWRDTVRTDNFKQWLGGQHPAVQALAGSATANDAITALRLYQSAAPSAADINTQRRNAVQQAAVIPASNRAAPSRPQAPDDFDAAWDFYDRKKA